MRFNHDKNDNVPSDHIHNNMPISGYRTFDYSDSMPQSQSTIVNNMMYYQGNYLKYYIVNHFGKHWVTLIINYKLILIQYLHSILKIL